MRYTKPTIYHGGKNYDLTKRWYVYFLYQHPTEKNLDGTPKMVKSANISLKINRLYKTKEDRLLHLSNLRLAVQELLEKGYLPYNKKIIENNDYTIETALNFALEIRKQTTNDKTFSDYKTRINEFLLYVKKKLPLNSSILELNKRVVLDFLNVILIRATPRTRNNVKSILSAVFSTLQENEIIPRNFILDIKNIKSVPQMHRVYTPEQVAEIFIYLEEKDPYLLLFIKFVSYCFMRPIEVSRIEKENLDLINKKIVFKEKNKPLKTKIIPDILLNEIKDYNFKEGYIFSSEKESTETNRRGYFGKQFKEVKNHFNLPKEFTIYSFRHFFITKLYLELLKTIPQQEVYYQLMLITGHKTLDALKKYLRNIDAELPADYSHLL